MQIDLGNSWNAALANEMQLDYFKALWQWVCQTYDQGTCYPPKRYIFQAFRLCPFDCVKVVILGQDPYHGPGQAHGLSFSVYDGMPFPPSLRNIFREVHDDTGAQIPLSGNLERWASQGVLLLNDTLTVAHGKPGSHQKRGWEDFTSAVIRKLSDGRENLVFMLWGGPARKKGSNIDRSRHLVLESGHPSPLSANRNLWFGNRHFSQANHYLLHHGKTPITW